MWRVTKDILFIWSNRHKFKIFIVVQCNGLGNFSLGEKLAVEIYFSIYLKIGEIVYYLFLIRRDEVVGLLE